MPRQRRFTRVRVPGDGDCFYHALRAGLPGGAPSVAELRARVGRAGEDGLRVAERLRGGLRAHQAVVDLTYQCPILKQKYAQIQSKRENERRQYDSSVQELRP